MSHRPKTTLVIPILAFSLTLAGAASVHAQTRYDQRSTGVSGSLQVNFGSAPHWNTIQGTRVMEVRQDERQPYDMFRVGDRYYAHDNNRWYSSNQWGGTFGYIDDSAVPADLYQVPRDHWRQYPSGSGWQGRDDRGSQGSYDRGGSGSSATLQVTFGSRPRWNSIRGTRVMEVRQGYERPDYDIFRYGNSYYAYNNNRWYSSNQWNGTYSYVDDRYVPRELSNVPRNHWRNYPQGWDNRNDRRDRRDRRRY